MTALTVQNPEAHLCAIRAAFYALLSGEKTASVTLTFDARHVETLRADYQDIEHAIERTALQAEIHRLRARLASKRRESNKRGKAA